MKDNTYNTMATKKVLGLDLGTRTIGIAISDALEMIASAVETHRFKEDDFDSALNRVVEIVKEKKVSKIVLGYPKHMNGDVGIRGQISLDFKAKLLSKGEFNVILWDERLSSVAVNRAMIDGNMRREFRKEHKDELAAVVILQGYLDFKR